MAIKTQLVVIATIIVAGCGARTDSSRLADENSGSRFFYYDKVDRGRIMEDIRDHILDNYVLLDIKKSRGIVSDPEALLADAIQHELQIGDANATDDLEMATGNLRFLDRVDRTIAKFADTHFSVLPAVPLPVIANGIELQRVDGSVRIVATVPQILAFVAQQSRNPELYRHLVPGVRIVAIDAVPVDAVVAQLRSQVSASSDEFADAVAVVNLARRDYAYPNRGFSDWTIEEESGEQLTIRLPYFHGDSTVRKDAKYFFEENGFKPLRDLQLEWDEQTQSWQYSRNLPTSGYYRYAPLSGMTGIETWRGADSTDVSREVIQTGYILRHGKAYGVLQIFGFSVATVSRTISGSPQGVENFGDVIAAFVKSLKESQIPLIIDLRVNGGGNPMNAVSVLSSIARTGAIYPATTRAYRVTRLIRQMLEADELPQHPDPNHYDYDETALAELRSAVAERRGHTRAFALTSDIHPNPVVGGYDLPVVALISPMCISACDGMAMLLKSAHRATLIGTQTNGTGAGFVDSHNFGVPEFRDRYGVLGLRLPNRLFGDAGDVGVPVVADINAFRTLNSENRPTRADIGYRPTLDDVLNRGRGWVDAAIMKLDAE